MSLEKTALTNYYSFAKKEKQQHKCSYCDRIIKGWGICKCSECNREFCRSHMQPSIGNNKKCPDCRKRRQQFMEKNASVEAIKIAENNYKNLNLVEARIIEEKLFKSIFANIDLFKYAQEDENQAQSTSQEQNIIDESVQPVEQQTLPEEPVDTKPEDLSQQPAPENVQTETPQILQAPVPELREIQTTQQTDAINEVALDAIGEQIFDAMSKSELESEDIENPKVIENLFSETFDNLFSFASNNKIIKTAILTKDIAEMDKDVIEGLQAKETAYNSFEQAFYSSKLFLPDELRELQLLGRPPVKPEILLTDTPEQIESKYIAYSKAMEPFENFMNKVNNRMGLNQRLEYLKQTGDSSSTVFTRPFNY